jgi:hypothetical protein
VAPRVERDDLCRIAPLRVRPDQYCGRGVGEIRPMVTRQGPRRYGERAINCVSAGIGADRVPMARLGRARNDGATFARRQGAPMQRNCSLAGCSGVGSQPYVTWDRVLHAILRGKAVKSERSEVGGTLQLDRAPHEGVMRLKPPSRSLRGYYAKIVAVWFPAQVGHERAADYGT